MKKRGSNRNRHTGRINAAKRRVLRYGRPWGTARDSRVYVRAPALGGMIVRDFDAERRL